MTAIFLSDNSCPRVLFSLVHVNRAGRVQARVSRHARAHDETANFLSGRKGSFNHTNPPSYRSPQNVDHAYCRLQTVQTMQTVQTEYSFSTI